MLSDQHVIRQERVGDPGVDVTKWSTLMRCCLFALGLFAASDATAGPPFRTDDPVPVAFRHYEFYAFSTGTLETDDVNGALPGFELTYGLIPNGQLQIGGGVAFDHPLPGAMQMGIGDSEISFKYRFIQEDAGGLRPQISVFPSLELPTGNRKRGLGAGHASFFLPLWMQKSFGPWTTYGGGGYRFNRDSSVGDQDHWFVGWLLQYKMTEQLTLGGEVFHETADTIDGDDSSGFNLGGSYDLDEHNHLLFSAGRSLNNASGNLLSWYLGWEFTD
jgi:hypothetical protein